MMLSHWEHFTKRFTHACQVTGRSADSVQIIAVSKRQNSEAIRYLYSLGITHFGENYLQEATPKIQELSDLPIHWHFIGHLQSRKLKSIFGWSTRIHTLDSLEHAHKLSELAVATGKECFTLIEINQGDESGKAGIKASDLSRFLDEVQTFPYLKLCGLMSLPPVNQKGSLYFKQLATLLSNAAGRLDKIHPWNELSMGTSDDFEAAIQEGATWIRPGRALFGNRV
jgi:hypothetical protein